MSVKKLTKEQLDNLVNVIRGADKSMIIEHIAIAFAKQRDNA